MSTPTKSCDRDGGETLIELLLAVMIVGIAGLAMTYGLTTGAITSDVNRKEATARSLVRDWAESLQTTVAAGNYQQGTAAYPVYTIPSPYNASYSAQYVGTKQCWTGSSWASCASTADIGLQQVTLQVASTDVRAVERLTVVLREPCGPGQAVCS